MRVSLSPSVGLLLLDDRLGLEGLPEENYNTCICQIIQFRFPSMLVYLAKY